MAIEAPQPADEAFEERLTWSPPREVQPSRAILAPAPVAPPLPSPPPESSAVVDGSEAVEQHKVREALLALREDIVGLRHAVLEWPDLERIAADVGDVRASIEALGDRPVVDPPDQQLLRSMVDEIPDVRPQLGELVGSVSDLRRELLELRAELQDVRRAIDERPKVGAMAPIIAELGTLHDELVQVKRRIALRAKDAPVSVDDDTIARIAEAVLIRIPTRARLR